MARPFKELDPEQLRTLAALGCTYEEIGAVLKVSADTLSRRYAEPIKQGRENGKASLRRLQWQSANKGSVAMLIWLGKQWLGQKERSETELTGKDGAPMQVSGVLVVPGVMDRETWVKHAAQHHENVAKAEASVRVNGDGSDREQ